MINTIIERNNKKRTSIEKIFGASGAALTSTMSSGLTNLFAYTLTGISFGTWEDYAVAFLDRGLTSTLWMVIYKDRLRNIWNLYNQ